MTSRADAGSDLARCGGVKRRHRSSLSRPDHIHQAQKALCVCTQGGEASKLLLRSASAAGAQELQPFLEELFELFPGAALEQHVPVGTLLLLLLLEFRTRGPSGLVVGQAVRVRAINGLTLIVEGA